MGAACRKTSRLCTQGDAQKRQRCHARIVPTIRVYRRRHQRPGNLYSLLVYYVSDPIVLKKKLSTVGFEPTPTNRSRPERDALDHSAKLTSHLPESNRRPRTYEIRALPTELKRQHVFLSTICFLFFLRYGTRVDFPKEAFFIFRIINNQLYHDPTNQH